MPFWETAGFLAAPVTGGASGVWAANERAKRKAGQADEANRAIGSERQRLMEQGMDRGRDMGREIFGQDQAQTGADVQDIVQRRRDRLNSPSKAADAMRSQGQQERRYSKSKGASDLQQRNTSYQASRAAGIQEDADYQSRLQDFQSLVGNIASTQSSLELGGGQLGLATQYIAPPKADTGIVGDLLGGLGL